MSDAGSIPPVPSRTRLVRGRNMRGRVKNGIGLVLLLLVAAGWMLDAQQRATADELKQAELDVPKLMPVLEVTPSMTVADVGAGAGAMTLVMAQALGPS